IPSDSHRGINYPPSAEANGPPFFQERSSFIGLPVLVHKLAVELKGKSQDSVPVFVLYIKNAKALQMESLQNAAPFWRERGTASRWLVVESRIPYVGIQGSVLLYV
ncbi:MAG: hypothetical protein SOY74_05325, partial [Allisonella histaminiformans]|uniref:hypothetical protein n=1 Tax=Allisonella histaminiformans TaxID=209880 RepID=UPI002A81EC60